MADLVEISESTIQLTEDHLRSIRESLARIKKGDRSHRISIEHESSIVNELVSQMNEIISLLSDRAQETLQFSMDLSMAVSECFQILREVRRGNLDARVPDLLVDSDDELISTLGNTLNETIVELQRQINTIQEQSHTIQELSTPVLEVWDMVLVLPVIGIVDNRRSSAIMERLLNEIVQRQARFVILDITGVEVVDTSTADNFIKLIRAAELLGSKCVLTGIRPAVAHTLIELGVDLSFIKTLHNLRAGLTYCIRDMHSNSSE